MLLCSRAISHGVSHLSDELVDAATNQQNDVFAHTGNTDATAIVLKLFVSKLLWTRFIYIFIYFFTIYKIEEMNQVFFSKGYGTDNTHTTMSW